MAFTPETLSVIAQPIGGVGMRFVSYRSDDAIGTVSGSGYFAGGESYGLRLHDLVFVSPVSGSVEPYILVVTAVDSDGSVTATQTIFDEDLTALVGLDTADGNFIVGNGTTWVAEGGATARASLGLTIGTHVPAYDDRLIPFAAGMVMSFAGASAPTGWLLCYGQAVSRATYAALFSALGTTWGAGDGSTTFNLPDLRGRVLAGKDDMGGTSANRLTNQSGGLDGDTLGATGGGETHTLTEGQLPSHTHAAGTLATASGGAHVHSIDFTGNTSHDTSGGGSVASGGSANETITAFDTQSGGAHTHTITGSTGAVGSGTAHNNVQPTAVVNFIIKT